ncbi:unnamed protein product [Ceutorhynchus assimilis]|uniref:DUF4780 domain-containing protein n=1 Tax=Ceutorhynchus assimilis TaxID=467358 RepID=A0A9N9MEA4_9CUCU|nr:unnamed protein product [Ceutorhynchus assimilis]
MSTNIDKKPNPTKQGEGKGKFNAKSSYRANSLDEIDNLTEEEFHKATFSGSSRAKLRNLVTKVKSYTEAKRAVIRENFMNHVEGNDKAKVATKSAEASIAQKRTRSEDSTPQKKQTKKPRGGQIPATTTSKSYKDAASGEKVAVVNEDYPEAQMTTETMEQIQAAISAAHENIPENGPQVRFEKCSRRPGYFEVTCADKTSAVWLMETVPTLKPWEGAVLKALTGEDLPKPETCTVFIPDEKGERLSAERILKKLSVGIRGLNTSLWKSWDAVPMDKGQLWTLSMDKQSLEGLKKLNMSPFSGFGRLKFRRKREKKPEDSVQHTAGPKASTSKADATVPKEEEQESETEKPFNQRGTSPLKRRTVYQQKDIAMEKEETRSKKLVEAVHACGHSISYTDTQEYLIALPNENENTHVTIPSQLWYPIDLFSLLQIILMEETLDKVPTFHGTQMAAIQRVQ